MNDKTATQIEHDEISDEAIDKDFEKQVFVAILVLAMLSLVLLILSALIQITD